MADSRGKKGFLGLLRSLSSSRRGRSQDRYREIRRVSDTDALERRLPLRPDSPSNGYQQPGPIRRRPRRPEPNMRSREWDDEETRGRYKWQPLTEWPPSGCASEEDLTLERATELIARGAPRFEGVQKPLPWSDDRFYALYALSHYGEGISFDSGSGSGSGTSSGKRESGGRKPEDESATDRANLHDSMVKLMSMRVQHFPSSGPPDKPWDGLEQPCYAFCFGARPGTVTLNHWATLSSALPPPPAMRKAAIELRDVDLDVIMERLQELEIKGVIDNADDETLYKGLYRRFLKDPEKHTNRHTQIHQQIIDLMLALSKPDWIDYSQTKYMIPARWFFKPETVPRDDLHRFFHQLVLSMELEARIGCKQHADWAKERLLPQLPRQVLWSLAVARRWMQYVRVDRLGRNPKDFRFRYKIRKKQVKILKRFAQIMKWPNLSHTINKLYELDEDNALDTISSHALAFFSGLILPGPTFPIVLMNALLDVDPDTTEELSLLTPLHPNCGFQYRGSATYWTSTSIVGKVLAPTCREVAGWVGPARPTSDLQRHQIVRLRTMKPKNQRLSPEDVNTMAERSDPLGPPSECFPVREYTLPVRDPDDIVDTVRIERLVLRPIPEGASSFGTTNQLGSMASLRLVTPNTNGNGIQRPNTTSPAPGRHGTQRRRDSAAAPPVPPVPPIPNIADNTNLPPQPAPAAGGQSPEGAPPLQSPLPLPKQQQQQQNPLGTPRTFDASILFAIDGDSWPLRLSYDVNFVAAWPCRDGPHPLFFDYAHQIVRADEVIGVRDWGGLYGGKGGVGGSAPVVGAGVWGGASGHGGIGNGTGYGGKKLPHNEDDEEKVLVIEAFGVTDNEVLARAWCAHWGLSAVIADVGRTCMSCAIREAYAATLTVVILVDDAGRDRDD